MRKPYVRPVLRAVKAPPERWARVVDALLYQVADDAAPAVARRIITQARERRPDRKGRVALRFTRRERALVGRAERALRQP